MEDDESGSLDVFDIDDHWYCLDDNNNVVKSNVLECSVFRRSGKCLIKRSRIGKVKVSTVFLCFDHSLDNSKILFETMIFGGEHDGYQTRCKSYNEALEMHKVALSILRGE